MYMYSIYTDTYMYSISYVLKFGLSSKWKGFDIPDKLVVYFQTV